MDFDDFCNIFDCITVCPKTMPTARASFHEGDEVVVSGFRVNFKQSTSHRKKNQEKMEKLYMLFVFQVKPHFSR